MLKPGDLITHKRQPHGYLRVVHGEKTLPLRGVVTERFDNLMLPVYQVHWIGGWPFGDSPLVAEHEVEALDIEKGPCYDKGLCGYCLQMGGDCRANEP